MNPAYAGAMKTTHVGVQYRDQWPAMNNAYTTYFATFDTWIPKLSSGIGFSAYNDVQGNGVYTRSNYKFIYSKEIKLDRNWIMNGSMTAGVQINSLNFNQLIFSDGLDPELGKNIPSGEEVPDENNRIVPDFGTGILLFNTKYFFGIACDHLHQPNQSIYSNSKQVLYRKFTAHFEVSFPWYKEGHFRKFCTFTPNFIIQTQGGEQNLTYGMYANRKNFSLGIWSRQTTKKSTDVILMIGYMGKQMKTAISYDTNIRGVGLQSHGAIELSISYFLKKTAGKSNFPFYQTPGEWDVR